MAVSFGSPLTSQNVNDSFVSKTQDSTTVGKINLQNTDPSSGAAVNNVQKEINDLKTATTQVPTLIDEVNELSNTVDNLSQNFVSTAVYADKGYIATLETPLGDVVGVPPGTDGQILSADSTQDNGLLWIDPPSGGGGGAGISWYTIGDENYASPSSTYQTSAVLTTRPFPSKYLIFPSTNDLLYIFTKIKVPSTYEAGDNIVLKNGRVKVNSTDTTKDILFKAYTRLIKNGDDVATLQNSFLTSANNEIAVGSTANTMLSLGDINLTFDGEVSGRAVAAGDELWVMLTRNYSLETASEPEDVYLSVDEQLNAFDIVFNSQDFNT